MTPCEQKGYKVGDRFKVIGIGAFSLGSIIDLYEDDGSDMPLFELIEGHTDHYNADGERGAYTSLENIEPINEDGSMTIKAGHKVKFAECAKHLKSYDKDAVGRVVISRHNGTCTVDFKNKGRKWTVNCISARNLTRFRGTQYEEVKRNEPDSEGWIKWEGGECPVERGTLVDVKYNIHPDINQGIFESQLRWDHEANSSVNIIAYRLHKPTEATAEQDNEEMTTLHDWVHELESINDRAIELRELIAKEVQKCGGSVEWSGCCDSIKQVGETTNFDEITFDHFVVVSGQCPDYLTDGKKYKVLSIDQEDKEIIFRDDNDCYESLSTTSPNYDWYAVTGEK